MLLERAVIARSDADLSDRVRDRIAQGAEMREVEYLDMPLWLFRHVDHSRAVKSVFCSQHAGLVVYADGQRTLRRVPASL